MIKKRNTIIAISSFIFGMIVSSSLVCLSYENKVSDAIEPFAHIKKSEYIVTDIVKNDNMFRWDNSGISDTNIKGYNYSIKIDGVPIIANYTRDKEIEFNPMYNGVYTLTVNIVDNEQNVSHIKEYEYIVNENHLKNFSLTENEMFKDMVSENEFNKRFWNIVKPTENVSIYDLLSLHSELKEVPKKVLDKIDKWGYKIYLTGYDLKKVHDDTTEMDISGLFKPAVKEIYISNWNNYIKRSTIHEIGHFVDFAIGRDSYVSVLDPEFEEIYNEESKFAEEEHHKEDIKEYFAYAYSMYIKSSDNLKEKHPKTFEYMVKIEKAINRLF